MSVKFTKAEMTKILSRVDDDFTIELVLTTDIPKEELSDMSYPYPFNHEFFEIEGLRDIGYSDKNVTIDIKKADSL